MVDQLTPSKHDQVLPFQDAYRQQYFINLDDRIVHVRRLYLS